MAEYIDREALLKKIDDAEPLNWTDSESELQEQFDYKLYRSMIESQPTADVVAVVKCKDCVYFRESDKTNRTFCTYHGDDYEFETHRNKFCSDGVKAKLKE